MASPKATTQTAIRTIVDTLESQESAIAELTKRQENEEQINFALRTSLETKELQISGMESEIRTLQGQLSGALERGDTLEVLTLTQRKTILEQKILIWSLVIGASIFYIVSGLYFGIIVLPI